MKILTKKLTYFVRKVGALIVLIAFLFNTVLPANAQNILNLPAAGVRIALSPAFNPLLLKAVKVYPDNPFKFDFIVDAGDSGFEGQALKDESQKLIKYFLASLTTPENDLWVNLSPYEKDKIIPESFGVTEMGRDLLAQDYLLKQITASLMYPEEELGKKFWDKVYAEAQAKYGTSEIPINTFNKVWIVPQKAVVYENGVTAYVDETRLKVMLEEDYLALEKNKSNPELAMDKLEDEDVNALNSISSKVVREIIIPELEKEVNTGKNFAQLRQVYNSLILANWYKKRLKDSILAKMYVDKNKIMGVDIDDKAESKKIYQQYVEAFKKGVYNYIKEDFDPITQEKIPRKYFSGGVEWNILNEIAETRQGISAKANAPSTTPLYVERVNLDFTGKKSITRAQFLKSLGAATVLAAGVAMSTELPVLPGLMGRWEFESARIEGDKVILQNVTRLPRKDGVVEEEFNEGNLQKDAEGNSIIVLISRALTDEERGRVDKLKKELGHDAVEYRVLLRNEEAITHRVYGAAVDGIAFIRADILKVTEEEKNDEPLKEALDHEARELMVRVTGKEHVAIREEQYQGGLRELITQLSNRDKKERNIVQQENYKLSTDVKQTTIVSLDQAVDQAIHFSRIREVDKERVRVSFQNGAENLSVRIGIIEDSDLPWMISELIQNALDAQPNGSINVIIGFNTKGLPSVMVSNTYIDPKDAIPFGDLRKEVKKLELRQRRSDGGIYTFRDPFWAMIPPSEFDVVDSTTLSDADLLWIKGLSTKIGANDSKIYGHRGWGLADVYHDGLKYGWNMEVQSAQGQTMFAMVFKETPSGGGAADNVTTTDEKGQGNPASSEDGAMLIDGTSQLLKSNTGGIDLKADKLNIDVRSSGNGAPVEFNLDPARLENLKFDGLIPNIITITPMTNLPLFLSGENNLSTTSLSKVN